MATDSSKPSCKVAFAGAGKMAREHLRAFADIPGVQIAGIQNRTRAAAESLAADFGIPQVCDSIPELFEKTHADLVVVAVLETAANAVSTACFEFPWVVMMEKPPGLHLDDAKEILEAAQKRNRRAYVALNRRFLSSTTSALEGLEQDNQPRLIQVQDQEDLIAAAARYQKPLLDNWMYANSIHLIDYLRIFGRKSISRVEPVVEWNAKKPGTVCARIEFESGDLGIYTAIWNAPGPWAVSVGTPKIRWEMRPLEQAAFQKYGERKLHPVEISKWDQDFKPGFRLQAEQAVAAVTGKSSRLPKLEDALETMALISAVYGFSTWRKS